MSRGVRACRGRAAAATGGTAAPTAASAPAGGELGGRGGAAAVGGAGKAVAGRLCGQHWPAEAAALPPAGAAGGDVATTGLKAETVGGTPTPRPRQAPEYEAQASRGGG